MRYETVLLDLDHTLFDSDTSEQAAFAQALLTAGVVEPMQYFTAYKAINLKLWAAVERGEFSPQQVRAHRFERLVAQEKVDADPLQLADDFVSGLGANGSLYDGALEVLESPEQQSFDGARN